MSLILVLLAQLALPHLTLTPGVVRPLSKAQICATRWRLDERVVTPSMRDWVFDNYAIPVEARALYVVDHVVPRSLGGADDVRNLWAQPKAEAQPKDVVEVKLSRQVCAGTLGLRAAQRQMREWGR